MYNIIYILYTSFQQASNIGASETTLYSGQIGASLLTTGNIADAYFGGLTANGGGTVKVYMGNAGNNTDTLIFESQPVQQWSIGIKILPTGAASLVATVGSPDTGLSLNTILNSINLSYPTYITITGTASQSNDITLVSAAAWATITNNNILPSCNVLVPPINSNPAPNCTNISCANYTPSCFTPSNQYLCGYLQGIDNAICNIDSAIVNLQNEITGTGNLSCANVIMSPVTNPYPCIPGTSGSMNLCNWALEVNKLFCSINTTLANDVDNNTTGQGQNNLVTDGTNGTFQTVTGLVTDSNSSIALDNTLVHGTSSNSVKWTSATTATHTLSTSTNISVLQGITYQSRVFVYATSGSFPSGATVSIIINGTGTQTQTAALTLVAGGWLIDPVLYTPDTNQNVTITIMVTGFTSGTFLNLADLVLIPLTSSNSTGNYVYNLAQVNDLNDAIMAIANPFVVSGGNITTSSSTLSITIAQASFLIGGKVSFVPSTNVTIQALKDNYIYYDTWVDGYVVKAVTISASQPLADATQIVLYKVETGTGGASSTSDLRVITPFTGGIIAPGSITGSEIAANTITAGNIINSGVTAATYGTATQVPQYTVNSAGLITAASNVNITFPVSSVNTQTGAVSLGLGNLNNVSLTSVSAGNILSYNGSNWVNSTLSASGIPSFNGSPANGYLTYWTNSGNITGVNTLQRGNIYNADIGLSINTGSAPTESIDVQANYNGFSRFKINNISTGTSAKSGISFLSGGISYLDIYTCGQYFSSTGNYTKDNAYIENLNGGLTINAGTLSNPSFVIIATGQTNAIIVDETQHVSIGLTPPNSFAALDIQSVNGALLVPRLTSTQRGLISPSNGMVIYNTSTNAFNFYSNGAWVAPF